jgi:pantetheine-phosphate adenylyltransferase
MLSSQKAVYPGSFDPLHYGHLDVIRRASRVFRELTVLVAKSSQKAALIPMEERVNLLQRVIREEMVEKGHLIEGHRVLVQSFEGLTVDYMKSVQAGVIVRGLRAVVDFEYELSMANMNRKLAPEIETMLIFSSPEYYFLSSRGIKELLQHRSKIEGMVPPSVMVHLEGRGM